MHIHTDGVENPIGNYLNNACFCFFSDNLAVGFFHHRLGFLSDSNAGTNKLYIFLQYMYIVCDKLLLSPIRIKQRTTINVPYLLSQNIK